MNGLRSLLAVLLLVVCPSFSLAKLQSGNFHVNLTFQANTVPYTNYTCRTLGLYNNGYVTTARGHIRSDSSSESRLVKLVLLVHKVSCANLDVEKECIRIERIEGIILNEKDGDMFSLRAKNTLNIYSNATSFNFRENDTITYPTLTAKPPDQSSTAGAPNEKVILTMTPTPSPTPSPSAPTAPSSNTRDGTNPGQHIAQTPPLKLYNASKDDIYLVQFLATVEGNNTSKANFTITITLDLQMINPYGYLSAVDYPALVTYGVLTAVYGIYGVVWLILMACSYKDLVRLQFWIGAAIILGFLEKTFFVSEYGLVNLGKDPKVLILVAEFVSAVKRALAWMLLIIISLGFSTVKPRLGDSLSKVLATGLVYFLFAFIDGIVRENSDTSSINTSSMVTMALLLVFDVILFYWILSSLVATQRALRQRKNYVKLSLYNYFTYTLIFAIVATLGFLVWQLIAVRFPRNNCITDWKELWLGDCYWHMLFVFVLGIIMILWRPSSNRARFAYSLVNEEDDEEEEAEQENDFEMLKMHTVTKPGSEAPVTSTQAEDDLQGVEENLPTTAVDKALPFVLDSDKEVMTTRFESSKMN